MTSDLAERDAVVETQVLEWAVACDEIREVMDRHVADFGDIVIGQLAADVAPLVARHLVAMLTGWGCGALYRL